MNIVELIFQETQSAGDKKAIVEGDRFITYAQLRDQIVALTELLSVEKIGAGHRIAFRCKDGIDYVVGSLALLRCGAAVVPVADTLTTHEIVDTITRMDVNGILTHSSLPQSVISEPSKRIDGTFMWQWRHENFALDQKCRDIDAAFIRFSSGTTGESKGVIISHHSIAERTDAANRGLAITEQDVILWVLGMSHHFVVTILLFLRKAAKIVVANQRFPFSVLEAAEKVRFTFIYGSPVHFYLMAMAEQLSPKSLATVRMAISTSMKMPPTISEKFAEKFGIIPSEALGIIEIGLPFINTRPDAGAMNNVGHVLPDYELRIGNPDEGGAGEVLIRGKGMFDGYFSPWRLREECLVDGWFHTGDVGRLDAEGRLTILGRTKTVIVCAGMKIFPEEVEEVINLFPGIRESLVFAKEHAQFGQMPAARIVIADGIGDKTKLIAELRAHCCRQLSSYKVPVEFLEVASILKTASGKLARSSKTIAVT